MLIITQEQKEVLVHEIENFQLLVENDDLSELLDAIDDLILDEFSDDFEHLSPKGVQLQLVFDQIYYQNKKN